MAALLALVLGVACVTLMPHLPKERVAAPELSENKQGQADAVPSARKADAAQARKPAAVSAVGYIPPNRNYFEARAGETYAVRNLSAEYTKLSAKANAGDLVAARTLFEALRNCRDAPRSAADLEKLKSKAQDPKYAIPSIRIDSASSLFSHCGELSDQQLNTLPDWTKMLADSGDSIARLEYAAIAQPKDYDRADFDQQRKEFVESAKRYINEEIESGNAVGLLAMAHGYMKLRIEGQTVAFEQNPFLAYQYEYAYGLTKEGALYSDSVSTNLVRLEAQLTPEQIQDARKSGMILSRCCSK